VRKRREDLGATIPEPGDRGPAALAKLVHTEVTRLTPIVAAARAKQ